MQAQKKRATAGTVTLIPNRPGRRINTNPLKDRTMKSHSTAGAMPATRATAITWSDLDEVMTALCQGETLVEGILLMAEGLPREERDPVAAVAGHAQDRLAGAHALLNSVMESVKQGAAK